MATTTNYSWSTPDDTALVKDGASAIRTLGTAIDTTVFNNASAGIVKTIVDAKGDLIAATAADTVARLGVGTNGQLLAANSSTATGLEWQSISGGGMTLIQETVISAASAVDFNSIPGTYKQLMLIWSGIRHSAGSTDFGLRFNSSSSSNYHASGIGGYGSTLAVDAETANSLFINPGVGGYVFGQNSTGSSLSTDCAGVIVIDNYASSTKTKSGHGQFSSYVAGLTSMASFTINFNFDDVTAITSLNIFRGSGSATLSNQTNTSIRLYGIS